MPISNNSTKTTALVITVAIVLVVASFIYVGVARHSLKKERIALAEFERERMEEELQQLELEYGVQIDKIKQGNGYGEKYRSLSSDSLLEQLAREKAKAEKLSDELRLYKANSTKEIKRLTNEVASLRKVLKSYVVQIDSLTATNKALKQENESVKQNITRVEQQNNELAKAKETLTKQVAFAQKLELKEVVCTPLDRRGKATKSINRIVTLRFNFTIMRNPSAQPGIKKVYLRLLNPNDMAIASGMGESFTFEGSELVATATKQVEYGGNDLSEVIYWNVDATLLSGVYKADFFIDGERVGRLTFNL